MKKSLKFYCAAWAVLFALFQIIAFVAPGWASEPKYTASFWVSYVCIVAAFVGQLVCAWYALQEENAKKRFYQLSMVTISYTGLLLSFLFGGVCMLLSPLPYWVGVLLCAIVLGCNAIAVLKAAAAAELVTRSDERLQESSFFIRSLTSDAESLLSHAKTEESKALCKKVYEVARYSDPMSHAALHSIEDKIATQMEALTNAVTESNGKIVTTIAEEIVTLIGERNRKCKVLK